MSLFLKLEYNRFEHVADLLGRHGRSLQAREGSRWADNIATVRTVLRDKRLDEPDKAPGYALGYRLLNSIDYCARHKLAVGEVLRQLRSGSDEDQDHAEAHLFVLAQFHCAAAATALSLDVRPVATSKCKTPDIVIGSLGVEIKTRSARCRVSDEARVECLIEEAIVHASEKCGEHFPKVVGFLDLSPRDMESAGEAVVLLRDLGVETVHAKVRKVMADRPSVPALVLATCMMHGPKSLGSAAKKIRLDGVAPLFQASLSSTVFPVASKTEGPELTLIRQVFES